MKVTSADYQNQAVKGLCPWAAAAQSPSHKILVMGGRAGRDRENKDGTDQPPQSLEKIAVGL